MTTAPERFLIPLTKGQQTLVDRDGFERFGHLKWTAIWDSRGETYYAVRSEWIQGKRRLVYLHREILRLRYLDGSKSDHINHNTLDNRGDNLRRATSRQSTWNTGRRCHSRSRFKGVSYEKRREHWVARIRVNGKRVHIGSFDCPEMAYWAYCRAAEEYFEEFACFG